MVKVLWITSDQNRKKFSGKNPKFMIEIWINCAEGMRKHDKFENLYFKYPQKLLQKCENYDRYTHNFAENPQVCNKKQKSVL